MPNPPLILMNKLNTKINKKNYHLWLERRVRDTPWLMPPDNLFIDPHLPKKELFNQLTPWPAKEEKRLSEVKNRSTCKIDSPANPRARMMARKVLLTTQMMKRELIIPLLLWITTIHLQASMKKGQKLINKLKGGELLNWCLRIQLKMRLDLWLLMIIDWCLLNKKSISKIFRSNLNQSRTI